MFSQPEITIPEKLPFLEKLCWQRQSIAHLTRLEMLQIYERGWRYQGVLGNLSPNEIDIFAEKLLAKAEKAYAVVEPLKKAIAHFQAQPHYRDKCFTALRILNPSQVIDGLDLLAKDFDLENTIRTFTESQKN